MSDRADTSDGNGKWQRLDRRTLGVAATVLTGIVVVGGAGLFVVLLQNGVPPALLLPVVAAGAVLIVLAGVGIELIRWRYTYYRVTSQRVELRFAFLIHRYNSVPRDRIRIVDIGASPVHRVLGLVRMKVATGKHDPRGSTAIMFNPLDRSTGEQLRRELLHRSHDGRDVAVTGGDSLAEMRWSWLRFAPISITTPALAAAALGGAIEVVDWFGLQGAIVDAAGGLFRQMPLVGLIAVAIGAGALVGVIGSLCLWIELWWSYRLSREPGVLLVRRGLFRTRSLTVQERRLRGIELVEPPGARLPGGARLDAVASGLGDRADEKWYDPRILLPVVPRALAHRVAADILREPATPTVTTRFATHPPAARRRRLTWATVVVMAVGGALAVLGAVLTGLLLHAAWITVLVLLPAALAVALHAYTNLRHGICGDYLVARRGAARRRTVALRRDGVVGWKVRSSPFQRRAGLVTLVATTAAGSGAYTIPDVDQHQGIAFADTAVPGVLSTFLVDSTSDHGETSPETSRPNEAG